MLKFRVDTGDKILGEYLWTEGHNTIFISKAARNKLIEWSGEIIQIRVVIKIIASHFYSVLVNEMTDFGISEQLSVCIRYFDQETCTIEEGFHKRKGLKRRKFGKHYRYIRILLLRSYADWTTMQILLLHLKVSKQKFEICNRLIFILIVLTIG